jgi:hypothetical protein
MPHKCEVLPKIIQADYAFLRKKIWRGFCFRKKNRNDTAQSLHAFSKRVRATHSTKFVSLIWLKHYRTVMITIANND